MTVRAAYGSAQKGMRQAAADELAVQLQKVADDLAAHGLRPKRVPYGRASGVARRMRSPKGFVLNTSGPRMLLPDGRLWHYYERRSAEGIYYDPRVDHERSNHGSIALGDGLFTYLGAVVNDYHFGYRHDAEGDGFELGALYSKDARMPKFVPVADALAHIVASM